MTEHLVSCSGQSRSTQKLFPWKSAHGGRDKWESGFLGQRLIGGLTAEILPIECGSVFRVVTHHFFVLTFEEATL